MYEASRAMTWVSGPQSCAQKLSRPEETMEHYSSYDCLFLFGASTLRGPRSGVKVAIEPKQPRGKLRNFGSGVVNEVFSYNKTRIATDQE
jgi:hypothetical protein